MRKTRVCFDVRFYLFQNVLKAWTKSRGNRFLFSTKAASGKRFNNVPRKKLAPYIASTTRLILIDFHNKGKHVECKFTICTSYGSHCLAERALFAIDRRIFKNKSRAHKKLLIARLSSKSAKNTINVKKSFLEPEELYEIVSVRCIFPFRVWY